jgi:hypothetical protein
MATLEVAIEHGRVVLVFADDGDTIRCRLLVDEAKLLVNDIGAVIRYLTTEVMT